MFRALFARIFKKPEPVIEIKEVVDLSDQFDFEAASLFYPPRKRDNSVSPKTPILQSMDRDWNHVRQACHLRGCVRPSAFTLMSTQTLDTDIRLGADNSRGRTGWIALAAGSLPVYREYMLCDRHYDDIIRGKPGTAYVIGPSHIYDPELHVQTQKKLGTVATTE